ncbi:hypothetical protein [Lactococcus lactis]|mgnify:FL=1|uniref:hypothetical protein n=1 Tax=Lactococcus lactis TaxID=1358 RepID=UPI00070AE8D6|nr:hypothetical protein [Lactococcus lactis]KRO21120.1 hypothetical protein IV65_GL001458 [Lactococcus lactis subsp. lactis]MBN2919105.1 hypothetical protein [Lactobacillus sp.]
MIKELHIIFHPESEYPYSIAGWNEDGTDFTGSSAELGLATLQCATEIFEGLYQDYKENRR